MHPGKKIHVKTHRFWNISNRSNVAIRNLFLHSAPEWWTMFSGIQHGCPESPNCSDCPRPGNRPICCYMHANLPSMPPKSKKNIRFFKLLGRRGPRNQRKPLVFWRFGEAWGTEVIENQRLFKLWGSLGLVNQRKPKVFQGLGKPGAQISKTHLAFQGLGKPGARKSKET